MNQLDIGNNFSIQIQDEQFLDVLDFWAEAYFRFAVTTTESSQKVQKRDLKLFLEFMQREEKSLERNRWSPRLSKSFVLYLQKEMKNDSRRWSDATINRIVAHIKTFSKWIHSVKAFTLGNPMTKIKMLSENNRLDIDRALTDSERRRLLDTCDRLLEVGGRSEDRNRNKEAITQRPRRKGYRPWRNRAIIYTLLETGMRRAAIGEIDLNNVDFKKRRVTTIEKGGYQKTYAISREGIKAIENYLDNERVGDAEYWQNSKLFLSAGMGNIRGDGQLKPLSVSNVWKEVCKEANIEGKTPHSARHAMGKHIMKRTNGNVAAVQRQLGHKNAAYSLQYARISNEDLDFALDDRP